MLRVLANAWALLFGLFLLMIGNGLQGTLLGVRGSIEGYSPSTMSWVMSAYFGGLLFGAWISTGLIRRVGHVRVFAALASLISAAFLIYAAIPHPVSWIAMRFIVGACYAGVYIVTESWLNESTTNETRGQALSSYVITQMAGVILAQGLLNVADPSTYTLFVIISVVVSLSVAPVLLSATPAPVFESAKRMSLVDLYAASPLGMVGCFLLGGILSAMFGMSAVYAGEVGFSTVETSIFVGLLYVGGLLSQYPLGWLSDRMDRRVLITALTGGGAVATILAIPLADTFLAISVIAFVIGGVSNPLYALLLAHTNDFLEREDMAAASSGLMFISGLGAVLGPLVIGAAMTGLGAVAFFGFIALLLAAISAYGALRMTARAAPAVEDTGAYVPVTAQASAVAVEWAQDYAYELSQDEDDGEPRESPAA